MELGSWEGESREWKRTEAKLQGNMVEKISEPDSKTEPKVKRK